MAQSHRNASTFQPGHAPHGPPSEALREKPRYTPDETRAHKAAAENLLSQPMGTTGAVVRQLRQPPPRGLGLTGARARHVVAAVLAEWEAERAGSSKVEQQRSRSIAFLNRQIEVARGRRGPPRADGSPGDWVDKPNHNAVARLMELKIRLEGTDAPIEVNVNVRMAQALEGVISNLTPAQVEAHRARHREMVRLAQLARARLPEAIDVEGVEVADEDTRVSTGGRER